MQQNLILKNATGSGTSKFANKAYQACLASSDADKLDIDKLETTPIDLNKLNNAFKTCC